MSYPQLTATHGVVPLKGSDWKKTVLWQPANPHPVVKKIPLNPVVRGPHGPLGTLPSEMKFSEAIEPHYSMGTDGHIAALSNHSIGLTLNGRPFPTIHNEGTSRSSARPKCLKVSYNTRFGYIFGRMTEKLSTLLSPYLSYRYAKLF